MKVLFLIIVIVHGLVHLMGFMKGFLLAELNELTTPVSKPMGILWLVASLVLLLSGILFLLKSPTWWLIALFGVMISQVLIFIFWKDALYGTLPNIIILIVSLVGLGQYSFDKKTKKEVSYILEQVQEKSSTPISVSGITHLPEPVQKWLTVTGIVGRAPITSIHMKQNYLIKLKPGQKKWYPTTSEQYATTDPPSFVWKAEVNFLPGITVSGRDKFIENDAEMVFNLLSVISVAKDGHNPKINESALLRFLGEMVWYPSAALSDYITWEGIDEDKAKATMTLNELSGEGIFTFDESGFVKGFSAMRYQGSGPEAKRTAWEVNIQETGEFEGIKIPTKGKVTWKLESGDWTWAKFEIVAYSFNPNHPDQ
jgi:hypothetical protein